MGIVPGQRLLSALVFWKCLSFWHQNSCKSSSMCPAVREIVTCPISQDRAARDEPSSGEEWNGPAPLAPCMSSSYSFLPGWERGARYKTERWKAVERKYVSVPPQLAHSHCGCCKIFNSKGQNRTYLGIRYLWYLGSQSSGQIPFVTVHQNQRQVEWNCFQKASMKVWKSNMREFIKCYANLVPLKFYCSFPVLQWKSEISLCFLSTFFSVSPLISHTHTHTYPHIPLLTYRIDLCSADYVKISWTFVAPTSGLFLTFLKSLG